ncbi:uncharacterized protein LOC106161823 [Lingula anatina]|uniref:Uncharacterized protein LOC106161823 n=1 Tax=Lingula anatina TaxID=7574 RepID=A0A1S3I7S3_LINAN|nr:uncharacterized protein LOC106161823 [Lingula anatina]|eukprot:XP_013394307.1 uncharacterized protein LOC106161823 [Lingula anatina]
MEISVRKFLSALVFILVASMISPGVDATGTYYPRPYMYFYKYVPWRRPPSTCQKPETPCYNYVLTLVIDGTVDLSNVQGTRSDILAHQRLAGRSETDAIAEGKRATAWLKNKYGIDFTGIPDEAYIDGTKAVTSKDGAFTFSTFILDPAARYRLVSASKGDKVQLFNTPVSESGWIVSVNKDVKASGTFNGLLPEGAKILYGDYVTSLCNHVTGRWFYFRSPCRNIFRKARLVIHFESRTFLTYGDLTIIDAILKERSWGAGLGRGVMFSEPGNKKCARNVMTFPATLP